MKLDQITGVVLAGGRGRRLGGVDKGLQLLAGRPLVAHVLDRLRPQVGAVLISANRHADAYAAFGHPVLADLANPEDLVDAVVPDAEAHFAGPLAGVLAALSVCSTPWLVCVPCDAPRLPLDLVQRLRDAAARDAAAGAVAWTAGADGQPEQVQPTFMLLHQRLVQPLRDALTRGQRSAQAFAASQRMAAARFADAALFANLNTPQDLVSMERAWIA